MIKMIFRIGERQEAEEKKTILPNFSKLTKLRRE
jgi:hypothetical protein